MIPNKDNTFKAFIECPLSELKVIFVGQDPYPKYSQATGVAFGVHEEETTIPFSLKAIIRELETDLDTLELSPDYSLLSWANQGVLLLNTALTLRRGEIGSHVDLWKSFIRELFKVISETFPDVVVVAVGKKAESALGGIFKEYIPIVHPAAEAYSGGKAGFYGCKIFSRVNKKLEEVNKSPINWTKGWRDQ